MSGGKAWTAALRRSALAPSRCSSMSLLFIWRGQVMELGDDRPALYAPLSSTTTADHNNPSSRFSPIPRNGGKLVLPRVCLVRAIRPRTVWDGFGTALIDLSGGGNDLVPV